MAKIPETKLTHLLFVRGGSGGRYDGKGVGGADLTLLTGVPEPLENIPADFADILVADGVCVRCTAEGIVAQACASDASASLAVPVSEDIPQKG